MVVDSKYNKWELQVWRRSERQNGHSTLLDYLIKRRRWYLLLTWNLMGSSNIEDLKALVLSHFDEKNDFYSEMSVDTNKIQGLKSIAQAIKLFDFSRRDDR